MVSLKFSRKINKVAMNNWIVVKNNIKKIVYIKNNNFHIEYDEEMTQIKFSEI
jgi:hypothetical protein